MGVGRAKGKDKAELAAQQAISSPLLNTSIDGARGILINITASTDKMCIRDSSNKANNCDDNKYRCIAY